MSLNKETKWYIYVFTYHIRHKPDVTQGQSLAELNRFELKVFLLLEWLLYQG